MYTKSKGQIQSPVLLKDYGPDIYCGYSIKLNKNARIKLTFLMMNFKSSSSCIVESLTVSRFISTRYIDLFIMRISAL